MKFHYQCALILAALLTLLYSLTMRAEQQEVTATTTTTTTSPEGNMVSKVVETKRQMIVTPVPTAKEVTATPQGYVNCFNVEAAWFDNVWVPTHRVCQYQNSPQGLVWIDGYWGCNKATQEGVCSNWEWKAGRWEKNLAVY